MVRINKVAALLEGVEAGLHDPHFAGYIRCFSERKFHEAYDVANVLRLAKRWGEAAQTLGPECDLLAKWELPKLEFQDPKNIEHLMFQTCSIIVGK